jgi:hypothetical protein
MNRASCGLAKPSRREQNLDGGIRLPAMGTTIEMKRLQRQITNPDACRNRCRHSQIGKSGQTQSEDAAKSAVELQVLHSVTVEQFKLSQ